MRAIRHLTASILLLAPFAARGQAVSCDDIWGEHKDATAALKDCQAAGKPCVEEQKLKDWAAAGLEACASGGVPGPRPAPAATPTPPPEPTGRKIAILVDGGTAAEQDAVTAGARSALGGDAAIDAGAIRAARALLPAGPVNDVALGKLRTDLSADRAIGIEIKAEGSTRLLAARVVDSSGMKKATVEATSATAGEEARKLVAALPSLGRVTPAATPRPTPVAVATPMTTPTPVVVATPRPTPVAVATPRPTPRSTPRSTPRPPTDRPGGAWIAMEVFGGTKFLDEADWSPLSAQTEAGAMATIGSGRFPVHLAVDGSYSFGSGKANGVPIRAQTIEVCVGPRLVLPAGPMRMHLGGGVAYASVNTVAEAGGGDLTASGAGAGAWAGGGASLRLGRSATLGVNVRYTYANAEITDFDTTQSAGGLHVGATIGFGAGAAARPR